MPGLAPFLPLCPGALLAAVGCGRARALVMLAAPLIGALALTGLEPGTTVDADLLGLPLTPLRVDRLSPLFGYLFHLAAFWTPRAAG